MMSPQGVVTSRLWLSRDAVSTGCGFYGVWFSPKGVVAQPSKPESHNQQHCSTTSRTFGIFANS